MPAVHELARRRFGATQPGEAVEIVREGNTVTSRRLGSPRDWYMADVYAEAFHVDLPLPSQDAPEGQPSLADAMLEFSIAVREYTADRVAATREKALELHAQIEARLAPDDLRRGSLASLRELLG